MNFESDTSPFRFRRNVLLQQNTRLGQVIKTELDRMIKAEMD